MDKQTLEESWNLISGVAEMTMDYLFEEGKFKRDKIDMIEAIDDAINELESWKVEILETDASSIKGVKK